MPAIDSSPPASSGGTRGDHVVAHEQHWGRYAVDRGVPGPGNLERPQARVRARAGLRWAGASEDHNRLALNIAAALLPAARRRGCRAVGSDQRLQADEALYYYPDVQVLCDPTDHDPLIKRPPMRGRGGLERADRSHRSPASACTSSSPRTDARSRYIPRYRRHLADPSGGWFRRARGWLPWRLPAQLRSRLPGRAACLSAYLAVSMSWIVSRKVHPSNGSMAAPNSSQVSRRPSTTTSYPGPWSRHTSLPSTSCPRTIHPSR